MDRRPLIIETTRLQEVRIDGPALMIRACGKSRQWFPMKRISSVICVELPLLGLEVFAQVARRSIPVNFLCSSGGLLAQLIHPAHIPSPLSHWLEAIPWDAELHSVYENWLDNQLRHAYGLLGCVSRDSKQAALEAESQLRKIARRQNCQQLVKEAEAWCASMLACQLQCRAVALGMAANSSQLARITTDLSPAGLTLCLTFIALNAERSNQLRQKNFLRFYQAHLRGRIDRWLDRAFFALANALERTAMYQDSPSRDFR